jgi:hypothetical protein
MDSSTTPTVIAILFLLITISTMIGVSVWFSQPSPVSKAPEIVTEAPVAAQIAPITKVPETLIVSPLSASLVVFNRLAQL